MLVKKQNENDLLKENILIQKTELEKCQSDQKGKVNDLQLERKIFDQTLEINILKDKK